MQMLCECTALQQQDRAALWGELLPALLACLNDIYIHKAARIMQAALLHRRGSCF